LAWSLWAVCAALIALALLLDFFTADVPLLPGERLLRLGPGLAVLTGVLSLAYPTVGALIASRLPTNPIGWIFCGVGLLYGVRRLTGAYADHALFENIALPGGESAAWFSTWTGPAGLTLAGVFLILLFPNGRLPSRRWRIVAWAAVLGAMALALADVFKPGSLYTYPWVENSLGWVAVIGGTYTTYQFLAALSLFDMSLLAVSTLAALFSLILQLRHAGADERQQLKWFLFAAVPAVVCLSVVSLHDMVYNLTSELLYGNTVELLPWKVWNYILYVAVFALLIVPVFTYIAILRYRLYEIDIIVNRTLVYGLLTATLVTLYFGGIVVLQRIFVTLTGQQSTLAVVASTLAIAALFVPLRRPIQSFIDRRFYRRKYDARKTLEAFNARLREETDLEALNSELVGVVRGTMQPAHVSLWLRPNTLPKGDCPFPGGRGEPDAASIVAAIEACTGAKCEVNTGKPDPIMLETIMGMIGMDASECVMTGDRLYTEIRMALDAGMPSAVVLTGETTPEMLAAETENRPDFVLDRIDRLIPPRMWEELGWTEDEG
jgi:hypothetical protein